MIKFWKNTARGKSRYQIRPPESKENASTSSEINGPSECATAVTCRLEDWPEDPVDEEDLKQSRLSKSLEDILTDQSCTSYFIQYLEVNSSPAPALFWMEVEKFRNAASKLSSGVKRSASFMVNKRKQVIRSASCDTKFQTSETNEELKKDILDDAVKIFKRYVALEAAHRLDLTDAIRNSIISSICHPEGLIDMDCFQVAQDRIFNKLKSDHYQNFVQSCFYCKYQIDILTSGTLSLEDVINNEMSLFYFMEFLEQELSSALMEFFMSVMNFKENLALDPKIVEKDAIVIYDKYFSMQALSPLGFTNAIRLHVEEGICSESGTLLNCFDKPFHITISALRSFLKSFLSSEIYFKYLSEMINATRVRDRTASECGSDKSIGSQNVLLASEDVNFRRARSGSQANMVMSSHQLYNPDMLWQRRQDGLNLGRVNSLGRFESRFEPDPDKKSGGRKRWSTVMGKLLPNSDAQMDEEMAWQVAHMIVKDVTDTTMATDEEELH